MPLTNSRGAAIPKGIGEGLARIASEGRTGIKEILLSVLTDVTNLATAYNAHTHAGAVAVPAAGEQVTVGTSEEL